MTRSRNRSRLAGVMALLMLGTAGMGSALAAGLASEMPPKEVLVWGIAQKLLQKGDEAVLALARLAKARLYIEKAHQPEKALAELNLLEAEIEDQEVRVVVSVLKILVMEKSKTSVEEQLQSLDGMISRTKERLAR